MEKMTVKEILAVDLAKNYKGENVTVDEYYAGLNKLSEGGKDFVAQVGNTLYICTPITPEEMEFHCANADSKTNFIKNGKQFLDALQNKNYKVAFTTYDDPRCEDFVVGFGFPYTITKIDQGKHATYKAEMRL
jgi:hypothetical protein